MSLSPHEHRALNCISAGLTVSDPLLAGLLGTFTRLTTSEAMPAHEQIEAGSRHLLGTVLPARLICRAAITLLVLIPLLALLVAVAVFLSTVVTR